mmetsp:Transcript_88244/g.263119  ORF Transcript_88244/g.263119 Transcript_88244/m.263119 type:complete len:252 (-) Transcript_88244:12-767(-)
MQGPRAPIQGGSRDRCGSRNHHEGGERVLVHLDLQRVHPLERAHQHIPRGKQHATHDRQDCGVPAVIRLAANHDGVVYDRPHLRTGWQRWVYDQQDADTADGGLHGEPPAEPLVEEVHGKETTHHGIQVGDGGCLAHGQGPQRTPEAPQRTGEGCRSRCKSQSVSWSSKEVNRVPTTAHDQADAHADGPLQQEPCLHYLQHGNAGKQFHHCVGQDGELHAQHNKGQTHEFMGRRRHGTRTGVPGGHAEGAT